MEEIELMQECPNCRHNIPDDSAFCSNCGTTIAASTAPQQKAQLGLIFGGVSVLIIAAALGAWFILGDDGTATADTETLASVAESTGDTTDSAIVEDTETIPIEVQDESPVSTTVGVTTTAAVATTTTTMAPPATTTTLAPVETLPSAEVTAAASSFLPDANDPSRYAASQTLDGRLETAWNHCGTGCSGVTGEARQGVGVSLTYSFDEPIELVGISIANGYQKISDTVGDVWPKNNRVASLDIRTEGGSSSVFLTDNRGYQQLDTQLGITSWVELTVADVYLGDGTYNDLAISEIEFLIRRVTVGA